MLLEGLIGEAPPMKAIFHEVHRIAAVDRPVLITGESGTGKKSIAGAIHYNSDRRSGPMIAINCAALPSGLIESEMFGHEKPSVTFTTATKTKVGRLEMAHGGTLLLDAIEEFVRIDGGKLKPETQAKLLRALQKGMFTRLGGRDEIKVDVRMIWTTTCDLASMVKAGKLLPSFFNPLDFLAVHLPPLRQRREDIPLLLGHYLRLWAHKRSIAPKTMSPDAIDTLMSYPWPGNILELENLVKSLMTYWSHETTITVRDLPSWVHITDQGAALERYNSRGVLKGVVSTGKVDASEDDFFGP